MIIVNFYEYVEDSLLEFAVIIARYRGKWVFCKHRERTTFECPGGRRESGEKILDTAKRELYEETGALEYELWPICVYSVCNIKDGSVEAETYGMLYYAEIGTLGKLPESEIERTYLFDHLPEQWTYPEIQPVLMEKVSEVMKNEIWF